MNWFKAKIKDVAPSVPSMERFTPDEKVWILTLDQIESQTGRIINKQVVPAKNAGTSTNHFDEGNVLYSKLRPYLNKVVCPQEKGIATTELVPLRPNPKVIERSFLTYYLRSPTFLSFATNSVAGVKMPRLIMDTFWNHEIPLPPPKEQRCIVEILDLADELRQKRTEADQKAERILPALFLKIFGNPATNPMNWKEATINDVIEETQYGTSVKANTESKGIAVIRMNNITSEGYLFLDDLKFVKLPNKELKRHSLKYGDLLFNRTNSKELVGKTGMWQGEFEAVPASYLIRTRVNENLVLSEFMWAFMNTPFIKNALFNKARHAIGMANINAKELRSLPCYIPEMSVQETFVSQLKSLENGREKRNESKKQLENLFNLLLQRAFSGELTAKWREAHLKELLEEMEIQRRELDIMDGKAAKLF